MPAFAFRHVIAMTEAVKADELKRAEATDVEKNTEDKGNAVIEAGHWASRATLDIIGVAGLGQDFGAIRDPDTLLNRAYTTVFKPSREAQFLALLNLFLPGWFVRNLPVKRNGDIEAAVAVIRSTCRQLIRAKKEKLEKHELTDIDILSVALESGSFSEENLIDQ
jgi:hypothetical protein